MRVPLIDGQGNFGSVDGDNPAAYRYTECRLARPAMELLRDLDKDTVDFAPNYDNSEHEPVVLPAAYPNLLVNGAGGIAVGMATNIPPHNLGEVIDACIALIDNPALSIDELIAIVPGPDFPTGGLILGRQGIRAAYHLGRGSIVMRGKMEFETLRGEREAIVVSEIPYQVNKASWSSASANWCATRRSKASRRCAMSPTATATGWWSNCAATPCRTWCSTSSIGLPRCNPRSAPTWWRSRAAGRR